MTDTDANVRREARLLARWEPLAGIAGILFVAGLILTIILESGLGLTTDKSPIKLAYTIVTHYRRTETAYYLSMGWVLAFLVYLARLWSIMRRAEGNAGPWSMLLAMSGLGAMLLSAVGAAVGAAIAVKVAEHGSPEAAYALWVTMLTLATFAHVCLGLFALTAALLIFATGVYRPLVGWVALVGGVLTLIGGLSLADPDHSPFAVIGIAGLIVILTFVLWTSAQMLRPLHVEIHIG